MRRIRVLRVVSPLPRVEAWCGAENQGSNADGWNAIGTGTPVRGGLSFREGHYICEAVAETGCLVALDIMVSPSPLPFVIQAWLISDAGGEPDAWG
jgi:hypothetical protein